MAAHPLSSLEHAISCYPILTTLASHISTLDLFHLALTSRSNHTHIIGPSPVRFKVLRRNCLCDGRGLRRRQDLDPKLNSYNTRLLAEKLSRARIPRIDQDEEIEVRVYNLKCDEALPCRKCGINICDECRVYPRLPRSRPRRRPHLNSSWEKDNVMVMCPTCEETTEKELKGKFLNELCDCDVFTRWICNQCEKKESEEADEYYSVHTLFEGMGDDSDAEIEGRRGLLTNDHQHERWFFCACGGDVPKGTRLRCCWCRRKHLPQWKWSQEWEEVGKKMPWVDDDPTYPFWVQAPGSNEYPVPYPPLRYSELIRNQGTSSDE